MSYARTRTDKRYHHLYLADGQRLPKLRTSVLVLYYPVNPNNQYNHHHHRGFDCNTCMPRCRLLGGCDISSQPASLLLPGRQSGTVGRFHKQMDPSVAPVNNKAGSIGDHSRHLTKKKRRKNLINDSPANNSASLCFLPQACALKRKYCRWWKIVHDLAGQTGFRSTRLRWNWDRKYFNCSVTSDSCQNA